MTRQTPRTDAEIRQGMKAVASVSGLNLTDERVGLVLPSYKALLDAMDRISRVELPLEAAPLPVVTLDREPQS
ncbi:MAG: hypothetical protein ACRD2N_16135 [Vicinamibacterales bacterium]